MCVRLKALKQRSTPKGRKESKMYTITWVTPAKNIETISTPRMGTAFRAYREILLSGKVVRIWKNKELIF